jgi:hypothetical protein
VLQGTDNGPAASRTKVFTTSNSEFASLADPNTSGKGSVGVYGHGKDVGVLGEATSTTTGGGVVGNGGWIGVIGNGGTGAGVVGNGGVGLPGVIGQGGKGGSGVIGSAGSGFDAFGVFGTNVTKGGIGVFGEGGSVGVAGHGFTAGVRGTSAAASGVGVLAEHNAAGGAAFKAVGPAVFSRSGILAVPAGSSKITKTGIALTAGSLILAAIQRHVPGVHVEAAVPDVSRSEFTVHLNRAVAARTHVAWFVVN